MIDNLLEVKLLVDIKVISETLSRIGIANKIKKILFPSCYLHEIDGKFYLVHFKQLFMLTRETAYNAICEDDYLRRNAIAFCLRSWGLIDVEEEKILPHDKFVYVLPHNEKSNWSINHKFNFRNINTTKESSNEVK